MDTTEESTLDEPVWSTIKRDLGLIGRRLKLVILPKVTAVEMQAELRDWDLWGPLFICMTLATVLSVESLSMHSYLVAQFPFLWVSVFWDIVCFHYFSFADLVHYGCHCFFCGRKVT
ncbi:Protein YIPF6 [Galdieria sulphuraria]|nr:Protein YIPF6 [Galdieria sulphuraria]